MNLEQPSNQELPKVVTIETEELKVNTEGKKYLHEKEGVFYGGDYLDETPKEVEINNDLPPTPTERNPFV